MTDAAPAIPFSDPALLAELLDQEDRLVLPHLDYDDAARLGATLAGLAEQGGLPVVVRVEIDTPTGPHTVFQQAMPGTSPNNDWWLSRKAAVVRHYGHSSFAVGTRYRVEGGTFETRAELDPEQYAAHGGCFPLRVNGQLVGVVGISGLPQQDDHALVVEGLTAYLGSAR
ncbi:heme-degrading domain-containing protein [Cellulomonas sp. WB94]|uniref:heme-degrading domain-containing protein n=1 Tax=Cellulomonas sp. WB94 TaxID=2173174 RepID=UPI000D56C70D|nr:heme-degrading domain-containing protein [Cellulomonas sp. WB94]PVU82777.1 heme-degrading domain-containing protein [Cellulomonas sp. WB94]